MLAFFQLSLDSAVGYDHAFHMPCGMMQPETEETLSETRRLPTDPTVHVLTLR
jgi:hypothetical protein